MHQEAIMPSSLGRKYGLVGLLLTGLLLSGPAWGQTGSTTVTAQVGASSHDAQESAEGVVSLADPVLTLGGTNRKLGLYFKDVNIPKGVKIDTAYIEFDPAGTDTGNAEFVIKAEAKDNGLPFTAGSFDISTRSAFGTAIAWSVSSEWNTAMSAKPRTPELATLVQEITDLSGWDAGDEMVFMIHSSRDALRRVSSYEGGAAKAPKLTIVYSVYKLDARTLTTAASDDLYQTKSSASNTVSNGAYIDLGTTASGTVVCAGLRFQDVNLPPGAQITDARLYFKAYQSASASWSGRSITIVGEKVLGPKTFETSANPPTGADLPINRKANSPLTTSSVVWNAIPSWMVTNTYASPSIANIIQEIVNQPGWHTYTGTNYKAISLFLSGNEYRRVYSSHSSQNYAPRLYIEYKVADGTGQPKMNIAAEQLSISRSCNQGQAALSSQFKLANIGTGPLNYTASVIYASGSAWLGLSPASAGTLTLASGAEQVFALNYQSNLPPGEYKATVRLSDPASQPTTYDIAVTLTVNPPVTACEDYPVYTKQASSPAALVLLDLSDSMSKFVDFTSGVTLPKTSNLRDLVMRLASKSDWAPGNPMVFNIRRESGSPLCKARSYDGSTATSPMLSITYYDEMLDEKTVNVRVKGGGEDGHVAADASGSLVWRTGEAELELGAANSYGLFLRFTNVDIPKNAYVTDARIHFVPTQTAYGDLLLRVRVQDSGDPWAFQSGVSPPMDIKPGSSPAETRTWYPGNNLDSGAAWTPGAWTAVYSRKKIDMAKEAVLNLVTTDQSVSWGYGTWAQKAEWMPVGESPLSYTRIHVGCKPYSDQHKADLVSAINATAVAGSMTPFAPSLMGAANYFSGLKPAENGGAYAGLDCQPKVLINVSDGNGNVESTEQQVADNARALAAAGVSVAGIGFVLPADEGTCLRKLAEVSNQEAGADPGDSVYALHTVLGGVAQYYNAGNEAELLETFQAILGNFKRATFFASAPAVSSLQWKDRILVSSFNTETWTGDLLSIQKDETGKFRQVEWSAYQEISERESPRSVWTIDPSAAGTPAVAYTDTDILCKKIGPIINSAPIVAGPPPFYYTFDDYNQFALARTHANPREAMVYVGANDGLLHAFKLADGSETWAFIPPSMKTRLNDEFLCTDTYCHRYFMDASPKLADIRTRIDGQNQWRTLLFIGQRQGGAAYTALDVTSGRPFDDPADPSRFLWEFTDPELGETWAEPDIARVKDGSGKVWGAFFTSGYAATEAQQASKQAYLYAVDAYTGQPIWATGIKFGLGITSRYKIDYVNYSSPGTAFWVMPDWFMENQGDVWISRNWAYWQGDNSLHSCSFKAESVIHDGANRKGTFFFDADSIKSPAPPYPDCIEPVGQTYFTVGDYPWPNAKNLQQNAWATGPPVPVALANNALNSPLAADFDRDHVDEAIYTGDLYGNMYRIMNIGKGETPVASLLCKFDPVPSGSGQNPIRGKATYAYSAEPDTIWVYWGTGRFESEADKAIGPSPQFFFGIRDQKIAPNASPPAPYVLPLGTGTSAKPPVLRSCSSLVEMGGKKLRLVTGDDNNGASWALRLRYDSAGSERAFTKPLAAGGIVFFTTFIPDSAECGGGGETYVFALDYATGLPPSFAVFDVNGDGKFTDADKVEITLPDGAKKKVTPAGIYVGRGVGSHPVLFKNTLFITATSPQNGTIAAGSTNVSGLHALPVNIPQLKVRMESWRHE
jgi:hypothetical protein